MKAHTWLETLAVEKHGEVILDAIFGAGFLVVRATREHQRQKMDRFLIKRTDGRVIHRVDYKVDVRAGETKNLALEHVSVLRAGRTEARGWIHTTIADRLVSYVPALDTAFMLEVARLRGAFDDLLRLWPPKLAATSGARPYQTLNCCVPIAWLRQGGFIEREYPAIGAQLRLPLRTSRLRPGAL